MECESIGLECIGVDDAGDEFCTGIFIPGFGSVGVCTADGCRCSTSDACTAEGFACNTMG